MRPLLLLAFVTSLAAACSSSPSSPGPCSGSAPQIACAGCCGSTVEETAVCSNGAWSCPVNPGLSCPICPGPDAGTDAGTCSGTPPQIACASCCGTTQEETAVCASGAWVCPPSPQIACPICDAGTDAEARDGSSDASSDASPDASPGDAGGD